MRQVEIKFYTVQRQTVVVDVPDHISDDALYFDLRADDADQLRFADTALAVIRKMNEAADGGSGGWGYVDWEDAVNFSVATLAETATQEKQ